MWKWEFWKLRIKFGNWNFEELFKNWSLKINNKIIMIKQINVKIGILEIEN